VANAKVALLDFLVQASSDDDTTASQLRDDIGDFDRIRRVDGLDPFSNAHVSHKRRTVMPLAACAESTGTCLRPNEVMAFFSFWLVSFCLTKRCSSEIEPAVICFSEAAKAATS
jgi:hypothetical protein